MDAKDQVGSAQPLKADIAHIEKGDLVVDVNFTSQQLTIAAGDAKLGIQNQTSVSAELVLQALFKVLPQGTIETAVENAILAGLKLIP